MAILAAARKLFVGPGYAATPLTAVAAEAGVANQTIYATFRNKRQLLPELVDVTRAGASRVSTRIAPRVEDRGRRAGHFLGEQTRC